MPLFQCPGSGDWSRSWGSFIKDVSLPFANLKRNKRSLALDMKAGAEGGWSVHYEKTKPPIPGGVNIDYAAGLNLMIGILTALYQRQKTGMGRMVSTDLPSVAFHAHAWEDATELNADKINRGAAVGGNEGQARNLGYPDKKTGKTPVRKLS